MRTGTVLASAFVVVLAVAASPALAQQRVSGASTVARPTPPPSNPAPWATAWLGGGFTNGYQGGYVGFTSALSPGRNLWNDTWILRGDFNYGRYGSISSITGDDEHVPTHGADLMLGYQTKLGDSSFTWSVGPHYETHDNSDPTVKLSGTEVGVRGLVEHYWQISPSFNVSSGASYSSAWQTWWAYGQLAYVLTPTFQFGPEISVFGNEAPYREFRAGAFFRWQTDLGNLSAGGGYRDPLTDGTTGYYVSFALSRNFN